MDRRSYLVLVSVLGVGGCSSDADDGSTGEEPTATLPPGETIIESELYQDRQYSIDGEAETTLHMATYIVEGDSTTVTIYPENTTSDAVARRVSEQQSISYDLEPDRTYILELSNVNRTAITVTNDR